jgi:hypothetical protein
MTGEPQNDDAAKLAATYDAAVESWLHALDLCNKKALENPEPFAIHLLFHFNPKTSNTCIT